MEEKKRIRFIDIHYNVLFLIPDGGSIILTYSDGETNVNKCRYLDEYHTEIGGMCWHICEFAERMKENGTTYAPVKEEGEALPYSCFSILPSSGELIIIERYKKGYYKAVKSDWLNEERKRITADDLNQKIGVTKAQEAAMLVGSMFGWNIPGADPKNYNEDGIPILRKKERQVYSMSGLDALSLDYEEITVFNIPALFCDTRIDRSTVPEGMYAYDVLSDSDTFTVPIRIAEIVVVNHLGTILTCKPIMLSEDGKLDIDSEKDWHDSGEKCQIKEFQKKYADEKNASPMLHAIIFHEGDNDYSYWDGFNLTEEEKNTISEILERHNHEGFSVRGSWQEITKDISSKPGGSAEGEKKQLRIIKIREDMNYDFEIICTDAPDAFIEQALTKLSQQLEENEEVDNPYSTFKDAGYYYAKIVDSDHTCYDDIRIDQEFFLCDY